MSDTLTKQITAQIEGRTDIIIKTTNDERKASLYSQDGSYFIVMGKVYHINKAQYEKIVGNLSYEDCYFNTDRPAYQINLSYDETLREMGIPTNEEEYQEYKNKWRNSQNLKTL